MGDATGHNGHYKKQYETAVELYRGGKCKEALALLDHLARDRPDSRHIIYYRALCLAALGRVEDAHDRLIELSSFRDPNSKELAMRLQSKIKPQLKELKKKQAIENALLNLPLESDDHYQQPSKRPWLRYAIIGLIVFPCLLAAVLVLQATKGESDVTARETVFARPGAPDQFIEITTFYPASLERPVNYIMCMAHAGGVTQTADAELNVQAGSSLMANWLEMRPSLQTALKMACSSGEVLGGINRSEMAHTVILPREGMLLGGDLQNREFATFRPGVATNLKAVIMVCGEPDHNESWTGASRMAGIYGKTYWWRNVGVAVDGDENVTHVLFRGYPQETAES